MNDIEVTEIEMEEVCVEMDEATLMKEFDRLDAADGKADGQINKGFFMLSSVSCGYPRFFNPPFGSYLDESNCLFLI